MTYDRPPVYLPATPGYVLAVIRDSHRQQCQFDPDAEPDFELTFETTIAEWRDACDLLDWKRLGRSLDGEWKLGQPDAAWRAVLEPPQTRTLGELCEFIAQGAVWPTIEPVSILGSTCFTAGAFLAIRSLLRSAGADVDSVTPSTPLDEFSRRYLRVFLGPISWLAPNTLPVVKVVSTPWYDLSIAGCLLGLAVFIAGWFTNPLVSTAGGILLRASRAATSITARWPPSNVTFGNLRTFRDLAMVVADGAQQSNGDG